jgi:hypothetical protein
MGRSIWLYFVPFQDDIGEALQELRHQVFNSGAYTRAFAYEGSEQQFIPTTIDALLASVGERGTHSILDATWVADRSVYGNEGIGAIVPMASEKRIALYGSEKPTKARIEERLSVLQRNWHNEFADGGTGSYVVFYEDAPEIGGKAKPVGIFFFGMSGT